MTPRKPLILLKKSGASSFQHVSRPTTKSRHFGGEIDGSRGGKTSKFLHLEVAESRREKTHETDIGCAAIGGAVALGMLLHLRKRQARGVERRSRPAALRDAELVHIEKTFRATSPVPIAGKLDRAYRLPSGQLVLVELKTRWNGAPNFSDVIQLSAQRVALSGGHRTDRCKRGLRAHRNTWLSAVARCAPSRLVVRRPGGRVGSSQGSHSGGPNLSTVHRRGGPLPWLRVQKPV